MAQYFKVAVGDNNPPKDGDLRIGVLCLDGCEPYDAVSILISVRNDNGSTSLPSLHWFSNGSTFVKGDMTTLLLNGSHTSVNNNPIYQIHGFGRVQATQEYDYDNPFISNDVNDSDKRIIWGAPPPVVTPKFTELTASASSVTVGTSVTITAKFDNSMTKVRLYKNNISSTTVVGTINPPTAQREVTFNVTESAPQTVKYIVQGEY